MLEAGIDVDACRSHWYSVIILMQWRRERLDDRYAFPDVCLCVRARMSRIAWQKRETSFHRAIFLSCIYLPVYVISLIRLYWIHHWKKRKTTTTTRTTIYETITASGSLHIKVGKFFLLVLTRLIDTLHGESEWKWRARQSATCHVHLSAHRLECTCTHLPFSLGTGKWTSFNATLTGKI